MDAYLAALLGFVTAAVLAVVNSWLTGRENVAEGVRAQRIATYPSVWRRTAVVSRWPRTNAGREHFLRLHEDLRQWYYAGGGLFLSAKARRRYEHLQLLLEAVLSHDAADSSDAYESLMEAASYFRTGLTDDLETRARRNPLVAVLARREERQAASTADARLRSIGGARSADRALSGKPVAPVVHRVTPDEERLTPG